MAFSWEGLWGDIKDGASDFLFDDDGLDWRNIATVGGGIAGAMGLFDAEQPRVGYQGKIPRYTMVRDKVPGTNDPDRRPGSSGQRYLSRPRYVSGDSSAARSASQAEAQQLAERNMATRENNLASGGIASVHKFAQGGGMPNMGMGQAPQMPKTPTPGAPQQMDMPKQGPSPMKPPQMGGQRPPMPQMPKPPQMPPQAMGGARPPMPQMPPQAAPQASAKMSPEDILNQIASTGKVAPPPPPAPALPPQAPMGAPPMGIAGALPPQVMGGSRPPMPPQAMGGGRPPMPQQAGIAGAMRPPMPQRPPQQPRMVRGPSDGMADKVPATIEGQGVREEARLSDGEFVVPADVVSHLGNGNSEAGANQLYGMMDKIRQARTGQKQQARPINPNQFMPRG